VFSKVPGFYFIFGFRGTLKPMAWIKTVQRARDFCTVQFINGFRSLPKKDVLEGTPTQSIFTATFFISARPFLNHSN